MCWAPSGCLRNNNWWERQRPCRWVMGPQSIVCGEERALHCWRLHSCLPMHLRWSKRNQRDTGSRTCSCYYTEISATRPPVSSVGFSVFGVAMQQWFKRQILFGPCFPFCGRWSLHVQCLCEAAPVTEHRTLLRSAWEEVDNSYYISRSFWISIHAAALPVRKL